MSTTEFSIEKAQSGAHKRAPAAIRDADTPVTGPQASGDPLAALCREWRERAQQLRQYAAEGAAHALEQCAVQLAATLAERDDRLLTVSEAATLVGRNRDTVAKAIRVGTLTNYGRKGRPWVRYAEVIALFPLRAVVCAREEAYRAGADARAYLGLRRGDAA